jgi:hypothetical protein
VARPRRVLVTGPAGSGKSYLARYFRDQGRDAFDADEVPDLARLVDVDGKPRKFSEGEWLAYEGLRWVWDAEVLNGLLAGREEVYLFGSCSNLYDFVDLFDRKYFLDASRELIEARLLAPTRDHDFGRGEAQRRFVFAELPLEVSRARAAGFNFVDASKSGSEIFGEICRPGISKRRP